MRPARNQQKHVSSSCSGASRSARKSCSPRGSSGPFARWTRTRGPSSRWLRAPCSRSRARSSYDAPRTCEDAATRSPDPDADEPGRADRHDRPDAGRGLRRTSTVAKKTPRPGRTLLIFGLAIVVLYGLAALGEDWKPAARPRPRGRHPDHAVRDRAGRRRHARPSSSRPRHRRRARQRQRCLGGRGLHARATATSSSRSPARTPPDLVDAVKRTAQLRFRLVAGSPQPGTPRPTPSRRRPRRGEPVAKASTLGQGAAEDDQQGQRRRRRQAEAARRSPTPDTPTTAKPPRRPRAVAAPPRSSRRRRPPPRARRSTTRSPWAQNPGVEWLHEVRRSSPARPRARRLAPVADDPDQPLITCDDKGQKFLLSKALIEGTELKSASYGTPQNGVGWAVNLAFKSKARKTFGDVTTAAEPATAAPSRSCSTARSSPTPGSTSRSSTATPRSPATSRSPRRARWPTR